MSDITIGGHVEWTQKTSARKYLHTLYGQVTSLNDAYATVLSDGRLYLVPLASLRKVGAIEAVVDDWDAYLRLAGDLSGAELG